VTPSNPSTRTSSGRARGTVTTVLAKWKVTNPMAIAADAASAPAIVAASRSDGVTACLRESATVKL
jgi:hypothetical protein